MQWQLKLENCSLAGPLTEFTRTVFFNLKRQQWFQKTCRDYNRPKFGNRKENARSFKHEINIVRMCISEETTAYLSRKIIQYRFHIDKKCCLKSIKHNFKKQHLMEDWRKPCSNQQTHWADGSSQAGVNRDSKQNLSEATFPGRSKSILYHFSIQLENFKIQYPTET